MSESVPSIPSNREVIERLHLPMPIMIPANPQEIADHIPDEQARRIYLASLSSRVSISQVVGESV